VFVDEVKNDLPETVALTGSKGPLMKPITFNALSSVTPDMPREYNYGLVDQLGYRVGYHQKTVYESNHYLYPPPPFPSFSFPSPLSVT
jgi:hypothetical protein